MNTNRTRALVVTATIALLTSGGIAIATTEPGGAHPSAPRSTTNTGPWHTPNECIRRNGGDFNACNVGNSGRGDRPYRTGPWHSPNECIRRNGGDFNACNVGNSGRGDGPYRPVG